jgi:hypothetical protein
MRLTALLLLALFPFVGAALLAWVGPTRSWSARYRHARARTAAVAAVADRETERLAEADARLVASQRRLRGEEP